MFKDAINLKIFMADNNVVEEINDGLLDGKANLKTVSFSGNNIETINNFIDDVRLEYSE